jgi:tRNA/rRNA methyltransferase
MWNFGLRDIRLVDPRDGWPNPRAIAMASGAAGLLEDARRFETTPEAVADCAEVYATTARPREMTKPVLNPAEAAQRMRARMQAGQRAAVLLGPERTGLENADVALADVIVTADTNPAFGSINLAQAALLMAYEWRRSAGAPPAPAPEPLAEAGMVTGLIEHLTDALEEAGYFWPAEKADAMRLHLQNILRRAPLTTHDVSTLRGAVRALHEGRKRGRRKLAAQAQDMAALRAGIDAVDRDLIALFAERQAHIARAAELKAMNGLPANIPARVEEVAANARAEAERAGLDGALFEALWRRLIDAAIAFEEGLLTRTATGPDTRKDLSGARKPSGPMGPKGEDRR